MALTTIPLRRPPQRRPDVALRLNQWSPLTRGLAAYYHINTPGPYLSSSNQIFRNLVTEDTPWSYPSVVNVLSLVRAAPNSFGGSALAIVSGSVTVTNVNPTLDLSQTGPGYTLAAWGFYSFLPSLGGTITLIQVTDGTNPANINLANTTSPNVPQGVNRSNIVTAGKQRLRQWTHIAFTSDGTTGTLYQDGQAVGSIAFNTSAGTACDRFVFNASTTAATATFGCDYAVWKRCLTPTEIYSLWNPQTRWDILDQPKRYIPVNITAPPPVTFVPRLMVLGVG